MKDATSTGKVPRFDRELKAEIDRLALKIRQMLDETRRNNDESKRLGQRNRAALEQLETLVIGSEAGNRSI